MENSEKKQQLKYYHVWVFVELDHLRGDIETIGRYVIADSDYLAEEFVRKQENDPDAKYKDKPKVFRCIEVEAREVRLACSAGAKVECACSDIRNKELTDERIRLRNVPPEQQ